MASLTGIDLDPNVKESTGEFTVVPAGKYKACLVGDELNENKAGDGYVLKVKVQIMAGQFEGTIIVDYINITNYNPKAQAIGQGTLKRICNLCNVPYPPTDTGGLMGKPIGVDVKVEKFTSNTTGKELESNKIKAYIPAPAQSASQPSATPQQQPQPVQNTASGW